MAPRSCTASIFVERLQTSEANARKAAHDALLRGDIREAEHKSTIAYELEKMLAKFGRSTKETQEMPALTCREVIRGF